MIAAKKILEIVPLVQSKMLLDENLKLLKKKKKTVKDFTGGAVKNIIGAEFIKTEADFIGKL